MPLWARLMVAAAMATSWLLYYAGFGQFFAMLASLIGFGIVILARLERNGRLPGHRL